VAGAAEAADMLTTAATLTPVRTPRTRIESIQPSSLKGRFGMKARQWCPQSRLFVNTNCYLIKARQREQVETYSRVLPNLQRQAAERLSDLLDERS